MLVVPKGVRHKPYADQEAHVMLIEPKDVRNTGNIEDDLQHLIINGYEFVFIFLD